jgi:AraC family transcriptional regulator
MIFRELPVAALYKNDPRNNIHNLVIHSCTNTNYHYPNHSTPYLLIANFKHTGDYQVNNRHISVHDKLFYFLNTGDQLEINFKNHRTLETILIMFSDPFIKNWIHYKHSNIESLLDNGRATAACNWSIPPIPFEYNATLINLLNRMRIGPQIEDMDNLLFEMLESFWVLKEGSDKMLNHIHAKRKSTREEIYKRLLAARLFMNDHFADSPPIDRVAAEACLDKFHFLKLFKNLNGITPHQYLIKRKLESAYAMLNTGKYAVMEVCHLVGFESLGSFSNLFKKYYQIPPSSLSKESNSQFPNFE